MEKFKANAKIKKKHFNLIVILFLYLDSIKLSLSTLNCCKVCNLSQALANSSLSVQPLQIPTFHLVLRSSYDLDYFPLPCSCLFSVTPFSPYYYYYCRKLNLATINSFFCRLIKIEYHLLFFSKTNDNCNL